MRIICTWFYVETEEEAGFYPQVGGSSSSQVFLDFYRRCLFLFFASARRANPDAELVLYLNKDVSVEESEVSRELRSLIESLAVETRVLNYGHKPPLTFQRSWRNQFFVFDVLNDLAKRVQNEDSAVVLDSDIVWSSKQSAESFWESLGEEGVLTYDLNLGLDEIQNGQTTRNMREIVTSTFGAKQTDGLVYSGGEFIAVTAPKLNSLVSSSEAVYNKMMLIHEKDRTFNFEEAHVLSMAYFLQGVEPGKANTHIKRIWTQPFKFQNSVESDLDLALLHVPAEKKYGIRRIYNKFLAGPKYKSFLAMNDNEFRKVLSIELGIPRNTLRKIAFDCTYAIRRKILRKIRITH